MFLNFGQRSAATGGGGGAGGSDRQQQPQPPPLPPPPTQPEHDADANALSEEAERYCLQGCGQEVQLLYRQAQEYEASIRRLQGAIETNVGHFRAAAQVRGRGVCVPVRLDYERWLDPPPHTQHQLEYSIQSHGHTYTHDRASAPSPRRWP